jgi:hypothetical protein
MELTSHAGKQRYGWMALLVKLTNSFDFIDSMLNVNITERRKLVSAQTF